MSSVETDRVKATSKLYTDNLTKFRERREVSDSMETSSPLKNDYGDAIWSEPYDESVPGDGLERIDAASAEWSRVPADTLIWALVTVSTIGVLTAMLIATIAMAV
jgi:hypothetical protein